MLKGRKCPQPHLRPGTLSRNIHGVQQDNRTSEGLWYLMVDHAVKVVDKGATTEKKCSLVFGIKSKQNWKIPLGLCRYILYRSVSQASRNYTRWGLKSVRDSQNPSRTETQSPNTSVNPNQSDTTRNLGRYRIWGQIRRNSSNHKWEPPKLIGPFPR